MGGLCTLQYAAGRVEDCPGARCPFWLEDEGACVAAGLEAETEAQPKLAQHLLELRLALDRARTGRAEPPARSLFYRLSDRERAR